MNTFVNAARGAATTIRTENGDKTYSTSLDSNVDLFFKISAIRGQGAAKAIDLFQKAYAQDADIATRILLHARDVREGSGERQIFRDILVHFEKTDTERLLRVMNLIPELGRWDDLFVLTSETAHLRALQMFTEALNSGNGLAAKWAPREGSKKNRKFYNSLVAYMGLDKKAYRQMVSYLSNTVEQQMCANEWDEINFSHIPSVASARYSKALWKHLPETYGSFIQKVTKGEDKSVKINTKALFPYDVVSNRVDDLTANALWKNLPDYVGDASFLPMIDLSESMTSIISGSLSCKVASASLGVYLAERNKSAFKNLAMAFADNPTWINIPETDSIKTKMDTVYRGQKGYSTNLDAGMQLILQTAIRNNVAQEDMPQFLIVLSDMEFNAGWGGNSSAAERTTKAFRDAGYKVPNIVWWNLQSRGQTVPVRYDEKGMVLVSGLSPSVTKSVLIGDVDPKKAMLNTVMNSRYDH